MIGYNICDVENRGGFKRCLFWYAEKILSNVLTNESLSLSILKTPDIDINNMLKSWFSPQGNYKYEDIWKENTNAEFTLDDFQSRLITVFTLHDYLGSIQVLLCSLHRQQEVTRCMTLQTEESLTTVSGLQNTFYITPPWTSRCLVSCSLIGCRPSLMYFSYLYFTGVGSDFLRSRLW